MKTQSNLQNPCIWRVRIYEKKTKQGSFGENPNSFIGAHLSPEN